MSIPNRFVCCTVFLCLGTPLVFGQTIDQIQSYDAVTGTANSVYLGSMVTVQGEVHVPHFTFDRHTMQIQGATGGILVQANPWAFSNYGDAVEYTGLVSTNPRGEIVLTGGSHYTLSSGVQSAPEDVDIADLVKPFDYETVGSFIRCQGWVSEVGANYFSLEVSGGDSLRVGIHEGADINLDNVDLGEEYRVTGHCAVSNGEIILMPRHQWDLYEDPAGDQPPVIANIVIPNRFPSASDPIPVRADVTDSTLVSVTLYYRDADRDTTGVGPFLSVPMSPAGGITWQGTIPPPHLLEQVHYYVEALDGINSPTWNSGRNWVYYGIVPIGFESIYDIQYVDPGEPTMDSPFVNQPVNTWGTVTVATYAKDADSYPDFVLQLVGPNDPEQPADYDPRWKGLFVRQPSDSRNHIYERDGVYVSGRVTEYLDLTIIVPFDSTSIELSSFGNPIPPPANIDIGEIGNDRSTEALESVWVRTEVGRVYPLFDEEFLLFDAEWTSLRISPRFSLGYTPAESDYAIVEGFLDYSSLMYRICPVAPGNITTGITGVSDDNAPHASCGTLKITPNPANPKTVLAFTTEQAGPATLEIFDVRGRLVRTLYRGRLAAGEHAFPWNGTDRAGRAVASGVYLARLRTEPGAAQVRELTLVR